MCVEIFIIPPTMLSGSGNVISAAYSYPIGWNPNTKNLENV